MKTILAVLKAGLEFEIGFHRIIAYDNGTMAIRLQSSLMSPDFKQNLTGLRQAFAWLDANANPVILS